MPAALRLLAVLAHPDDESLGLGGTLARYAAEGVETHLLTATRGERGRYFTNENRPSDEEVGRVREAEVRAAASELGIARVEVLGYPDGGLDRVDPADPLRRITRHIREVRPQVVVTFDPFGAYGHPDHIAISQLATAASIAAASPAFSGAGFGGTEPHAVSKLYYLAWGPESWAAYEMAFRRLTSRVDGVERAVSPWPEWSLTTRIDAREHWSAVWRAVQRHETQLAIYARLGELTAEQHEALWGRQSFYRAFSTVSGGREVETDLFEGVR